MAFTALRKKEKKPPDLKKGKENWNVANFGSSFFKKLFKMLTFKISINSNKMRIGNLLHITVQLFLYIEVSFYLFKVQSIF